MTKCLMALLVLLSFATANAGQVCTEVDSKLNYTAIDANFDGSIVVSSPRLMVRGKFTLLTDDASGNGAILVCRLAGKASLVSIDQGSYNEPSVSIDSNGKLAGLPEAGYYKISKVLCR